MNAKLVMTALIAVAVTGCATTEAPDPLERLNRKGFAFNDGVDEAVLKPMATTYLKVTPGPVSIGVANFFANAQDIGSAANLLLQGRPAEGGPAHGFRSTGPTRRLLRTRN